MVQFILVRIVKRIGSKGGKMKGKSMKIKSLIAVVIVIIFTVILTYPLSTEKGYARASEIYTNSNHNIDLVEIYLKEEYPLDGLYKKINQERRKEILDLLYKDLINSFSF